MDPVERRAWELDEDAMAHRSERMLHAFGLDEMVHEPIYRERQPTDTWTAAFVPIEREALKMMGTMWKERNDH